MNTNLVEQRLIEKIRQLSSMRIVEIEDFIDFLYQRENQEQLSIGTFYQRNDGISSEW